MKILIAFFAVLAVATYTSAAVLPQVEELIRLEDVDTGLVSDADAPIVRERRFTCDLFSFSSQVATPNHSACAAKCIGKGRKGGHCEGTNCVCRNDKWVG